MDRKSEDVKKGASVTLMGSDRSFIYTIFSLGASHIGFGPGLEEIACPNPTHELEPTAHLRGLLSISIYSSP